MNPKAIIWIDDREDEMEKVVEGAFVELWKSNIVSRIAFFGDAYPECVCDDPVLFANEQIIGTFKRFCYNIKNTVGGIVDFEENIMKEVDKELLRYYNSNQEKLVFCIPDEGENKQAENISSLIKAWKETSKDFKNAWCDSKCTLEEKYSVKCVFESIKDPKDFVYALDLVLLKKDEDKLNCELDESYPVVSMELYHYITKELNAPCLLYTRYSYLNRLRDNWIEVYSKRYDCSIDKESIRPRDGLNHGSINSTTINQLREMCEKGVS